MQIAKSTRICLESGITRISAVLFSSHVSYAHITVKRFRFGREAVRMRSSKRDSLTIWRFALFLIIIPRCRFWHP